MLIYIYGSESFRKDIHAVLNHSNIKFKLDKHGEIKDLMTLKELKDAIEENPNNIYLIDDKKIIKKNSLNQKIKFLQAKDAIEQEYLLDNGIGDISVDSIDELANHIRKKLETMINEEESSEIQESIVEMVEDAYDKDSEDEDDENYLELDEELSQLLSNNKVAEEEVQSQENSSEEFALDNAISIINEIDEIDKVKEEDISLLLDELSFSEDLDNIENKKEKSKEETIETRVETEESTQGDDSMAGDFSQFDTLDEEEVLAALEGMNNISSSSNDTLKKSSSNTTKVEKKEEIDVSGSNVNDIAQLISSLLNNKTLEITIKVKN